MFKSPSKVAPPSNSSFTDSELLFFVASISGDSLFRPRNKGFIQWGQLPVKLKPGLSSPVSTKRRTICQRRNTSLRLKWNLLFWYVFLLLQAASQRSVTNGVLTLIVAVASVLNQHFQNDKSFVIYCGIHSGVSVDVQCILRGTMQEQHFSHVQMVLLNGQPQRSSRVVITTLLIYVHRIWQQEILCYVFSTYKWKV